MAKMVAVCQQGLKPLILRIQTQDSHIHHYLLCSSITLHKCRNLLPLDILFQAAFQNHKGTPTQLQTCTKTQTYSLLQRPGRCYSKWKSTQTRKLEGVHITCTIKPESLKVQTPSVENELEQFLQLPEAVSVSVWNLRKRLQVRKEQVVWTMHSDRQPIEPGGWRRKKRTAGQTQATRKTR